MLKRREVLVGASALVACGPAALPTPSDTPPTIDAQTFDKATRVSFAPADIPENPVQFALGVQAGLVQQDSALLWSFTQVPGPVRVRVWRELGPGSPEVALVKELTVSSDANGYLRTRIDGLAPATWYRYGIFTPDLSARAVLGRFRTAFPADWEYPLVLGATACTNFSFMPYVALELAAKQNLDLFVHLGDMSYNDGSTVLSEFRDKWRRTLKDPGYRALLASTSFSPVWDDHEFRNDLDPETAPPAQLEAARTAYFETLATEPNDGKLWRSFRWGKTAEFFLLDCRTERRPSTRETPQGQYLSPAQLDWLINGLRASPARFKVLLNSVPITRFPAGLWGLQGDRWQGYDAQREQLLTAITEANLEGVLFITGDFHLGLVMKLEQQGPRSRLWEVAAGPGGNGNNPLGLLVEPGADPKNREFAFPKAQFAYASGAYAATSFTFRPRQRAVQVQFFDPKDGAVRFDGTLDLSRPPA